MEKVLIVCYSWSNGNTSRIAGMLRDALGAEYAEIKTVAPYPEDYNETVDQGQKEVEEGFTPEIEPINRDPDDYGIIVLATPTWWYTMAPAMLSYIRSVDWNGRTVIPLATNGGWPGHLMDDIKAECRGARIECPMEVRFDSEGGPKMVTPEKDVRSWISSVKELAGKQS